MLWELGGYNPAGHHHHHPLRFDMPVPDSLSAETDSLEGEGALREPLTEAIEDQVIDKLASGCHCAGLRSLFRSEG